MTNSAPQFNLNQSMDSNLSNQEVQSNVINDGGARKRDHSGNNRASANTSSAMTAYLCSICQTLWPRTSDLKSHQFCHIPTNQSDFSCEFCVKQFSQKSALTLHMRIHTGERPYKCDYCDKRFISNDHRNQHERIHTGSKPFECELCGVAFRHKSTLIEHMRTHSGVRPFKCTQCDKSFQRLTTLNNHQLTHSSERPFECGQCGYKCKWKPNLKKHVRTIHEHKQ